MKRAWPTVANVLTGIFATAVCALPQAYTISAKPGVVNFVEGNVFLDGKPISSESVKAIFVSANDTISTDIGKAEVLLTPGVFLRLGDNTQVRMISPSLTETQLEVKAGEAMIEADDIVKDSKITVLAAGATIQVDRNGLYKVAAGASPTVSVLEGKTNVFVGDRKTELGKGKEMLLADAGKTKKFDPKRSDDLYAWSNVRSEYNAAASYQAARDVNTSSYGGVWGGYGFGGYSNAGWLWNSAFNTYSWLPGNGAFFSPFGYGFYSPGYVGYAPVIYAPVYGGGGWNRSGSVPVGGSSVASGNKPVNRPVPVNAARPPAVGANITSPLANQAARTQSLRSYSSTGFRTASGATVPAGRTGFGGGGGHAASAGASGGGGYSGGGRSSGGFSGAASSSAGASHSGGGSAGGGGGASHH